MLMIGNLLGDKEMEMIANSLNHNASLKGLINFYLFLVLDLCRNEIGDVGISALGSSLAKNDRLTSLNLSIFAIIINRLE